MVTVCVEVRYMVNMNSIEILAGHKCFDLLLTDCIGDNVGGLFCLII